jgi:hypothetical protein
MIGRGAQRGIGGPKGARQFALQPRENESRPAFAHAKGPLKPGCRCHLLCLPALSFAQPQKKIACAAPEGPEARRARRLMQDSPMPALSAFGCKEKNRSREKRLEGPAAQERRLMQQGRLPGALPALCVPLENVHAPIVFIALTAASP